AIRCERQCGRRPYESHEEVGGDGRNEGHERKDGEKTGAIQAVGPIEKACDAGPEERGVMRDPGRGWCQQGHATHREQSSEAHPSVGMCESGKAERDRQVELELDRKAPEHRVDPWQAQDLVEITEMGEDLGGVELRSTPPEPGRE